MEKTLCNKILHNGIRCKNNATHGEYCGIHKYKDPLLLMHLHEDIIYNILQCMNDPNDLNNFAQMSPSIRSLTKCRIIEMITNELLLECKSRLNIVRKIYWYNKVFPDKYLCPQKSVFIFYTNTRYPEYWDGSLYVQHRQTFDLGRKLEHKWNHLLFLAIGGLNMAFNIVLYKTSIHFNVNNKYIRLEINDKWSEDYNYSDENIQQMIQQMPITNDHDIKLEHINTFYRNNVETTMTDELIFCIEVKDINTNRTYKLKTTNINGIEVFFWKHCIMT